MTLWLETFCFHCSVRLGVIVAAIISLITTFIEITLVSFYVSSHLDFANRFIYSDDSQNPDTFIGKVLVELTSHPQPYVIVLNVFLTIHVLSCSLAVFGAIKLRKLFLIPFIGTQFLKFVLTLVVYVMTMIRLKEYINLGLLIGLTIAAGFDILFIGYCWTAAVGLFQIIIMVNSSEYKALYGDDPISARELNNILSQHEAAKNVKVSLMPTDNDFNALKDQGLIGHKQHKIIEVLPTSPTSKSNDDELIMFNYWHWNELIGPNKYFKRI